MRREGHDKASWVRIGTTFENSDGSWNLLFDFTPTDPDTGIQVRDPKPRQEPEPERGSRRSRRG